MTTNTIILVVIAFLMGAVVGIGAFIGMCKLIWFVQALKAPTKQKFLSWMDRMYRKVESL